MRLAAAVLVLWAGGAAASDQPSISVSPNPPRRGEAATLTVTIPHVPGRPPIVDVHATVSGAAMLRRASDGGTARARRVYDSQTSPPLDIDWRGVELRGETPRRLTIDIIVRNEEASWLNVHVRASNREGTDVRTASLEAPPVWPVAPRPVKWMRLAPLILAALLLATVALPTVLLVWRKERVHVASLGLGFIALILSSALVFSAWADWNDSAPYELATCEVRDVMIVERSRVSRSTGSVYYYASLFAVDVRTRSGSVAAIAGDDESVPNVVLDDAKAWAAKYRLGMSYPCWYRANDFSRQVLFDFEDRRSIGIYVVAGLLLAVVSLPGWISRRRSTSNKP